MKLQPVTSQSAPTYPPRSVRQVLAAVAASATLLATGCGEEPRMAGDVAPVRPPGEIAALVEDPPKPPDTPLPAVEDPPKPPDTPPVTRTAGVRPPPRLAGRMAPPVDE